MFSSEEIYLKGFEIIWEAVGADSYLREIPALRGLKSLRFHSPVTFFTGENGSGKSTLLEAIAAAYGFNPEGGTVNYNFATYNSHSQLHEAVQLVRGSRRAQWGYFLRAESFYNVASAEEAYTRIQGVPQHYHEQSHGESFLSVIQKNFAQNGLYLLDEPEAALSPQRQLTLLVELAEYAADGAQFLIVTHSPILLGLPDAEILCFDEGGIHPVSYEETPSYQITKMFVNDRARVLRHLLDM